MMLEKEEGISKVIEDREDVGLGVAGLYHLLKSDRLEVMKRQQSARPEVVEMAGRSREEAVVARNPSEKSLDRKSARHSLKSQVGTDTQPAEIGQGT